MAKEQQPQNAWMFAAFIFAGLLVLSLVWNGFLTVLLAGSGTGGGMIAAPTPTPMPTQQQPQQPTALDIDLSNARSLGDEDAPVVMVEYSSYTCSFCARFHTETLPQIKQNYIDSGEVRFVYKHFTRNDQDITVAGYAECAGDQGQFFEYTDLVFENQGQVGSTDALVGFAEELGLDMDEFNSCVAAGTYEDLAREHAAEGRANGVSGTPTFFINGQRVVGAQPYATFEAAIDAEL